MVDVATIMAFGDELRKIAVSIPGLSTGPTQTPGASLGKLSVGGAGVRPPTVPKIGVPVPKVKVG